MKHILVLFLWLALLMFAISAISKEDAYIVFPDGSIVENPFNAEFFEEDPIPLGFANPRQSMTELADEVDPAGIGTSCDFYNGERNLIKTLKERFGLTDIEAIRCLDLVNISGAVVAYNMTTDKISEDIFLKEVEELDISLIEKMKYQRVIRDTIRALKNGKISANPHTGVIAEETARTNHFAKIILNCAHRK